MKKLLVFTGGGVAPALNPTIVGVVRRAKEKGLDVFGGRRGWACLCYGTGIVSLNELSEVDLQLLAKTGGSFLGNSRTNPFSDPGWTVRMSEAADAFDYIVAIGGDDTLGAAHEAYKRGLPIVGVPKTIDNDLSGTFFTPGFPTAADTVARIAKSAKITAMSRRNVHLIETLGGKAGWLTASAFVGGADLVIPPEQPVALDRFLGRIVDLSQDGRGVVVALSHYADLGVESVVKGRSDTFGLKRPYLLSVSLREMIEEKLGGDVEVKVIVPGNYPSAADPIEIDTRTALALGSLAVDLLLKGGYGAMSRVNPDLSVSSCRMEEAIGSYRNLTADLFDFELMRPTGAYLAYLEGILGRKAERCFEVVSSL